MNIDQATMRAAERYRLAQQRTRRAQQRLDVAHEQEAKVAATFYRLMTNRAEKGLPLDVWYSHDADRFVYIVGGPYDPSA